MKIPRTSYPVILTGASGVIKNLHNNIIQMHQMISQAVNGNLTFGTAKSPSDSNIQGMMLQTTSPSTADKEFTLPHNLNYTPQYFHVTSVDQAATIYKGDTPWTDTQVYLKCNIASTNLSVFVH